MSKRNKLLMQLLRRPKDFTFKELEKLMTNFGFVLSSAGGTSGSVVRFINHDNGHIIRLHKPHPQPVLKPHLVAMVINELMKGGYLDGK